ncbi:MAG: hypothetical protein NVSMB63_05050 [Sediminibacterium sp.]
MRLIFTLFSLLLFSFTAGAQNLTGIWRGYFSSSDGIYRGDIKETLYKYEIQLDQQSNHAVKGVTYSYKSTVFYAKTGLQGIFAAPSKSLIVKETKILELKINDLDAPCLMTCYLDYSKIGKLEILQGTFISVNTKDKTDCGSGKVYLEKVPLSDFRKEDFLLKKKTPETTKTNPAAPSVQKSPPVKKPIPSAKITAPKNAIQKPPVTHIPDQPISNWKADTIMPRVKENMMHPVPVPRVLLERENRLVKTIYTDEESIQVDLYDNGTIDNDTISLYHNNHLVVSNGRLSYSAITYKTKCTKADPHHEFVIVAENLGEIPPNTALMVITLGKSKKRYEIFLASTEERNAKVVIEYKPSL